MEDRKGWNQKKDRQYWERFGKERKGFKAMFLQRKTYMKNDLVRNIKKRERI